MKKDKRLIPYGDYCYTRGTRREKKCPYWSIRKGKPKMRNGYCAFLEKGDWDINAEKVWTVTMRNEKGKYEKIAEGTAKKLGIEGSWLWDQVKECRLKERTTKTGPSKITTVVNKTLKDLKNIKEK
jgi:hypothetical protein